jgi:hypothetical protein
MFHTATSLIILEHLIMFWSVKLFENTCCSII